MVLTVCDMMFLLWDFNDAFSIDTGRVTDELKRIWKEGVIA
jgi:hypothetical protein